MIARKLILAAVGAAALLSVAPAAHAEYYGPGYHDGWREREWRERERAREWREHLWRERHRHYEQRYAPGYDRR